MSNLSNPRTRRAFIQSLGLLGGAMAFHRQTIASFLQTDPTDEEIIRERLRRYIHSMQARDIPMPELMVALGRSFLGTPYSAHTLENNAEERLVVNLREVDCVTFVENTLALARCAKLKVDSMEEFSAQLQRIRYRGEIINGYSSRLHYFSDWIVDNAEKGIVEDVTAQIGGIRMEKTINFMSTHRSSYKQLADDAVLKEITLQEEQLNARELWFLPKEKLAKAQEHIRDGDILAITTSIAGLDVSHTGLAVWEKKQLKLLHAPITGEVVQVSKRTLVEHLNSSQKYTGLLVARPLAPKEL